MALVNRIWVATLTRNEDDAGTDSGRLNLTVNVDGIDVVDRDFGFMNAPGILSNIGPDSNWLGRAQAALSDEELAVPIESAQLTNSSIRLGIRDDDAWAPQQALILGHTDRRIIALAMETDLEHWMSTDSKEGKLTMPLRLVGQGTSSTLIRRVMLLVYTFSGDVETDNAIQFQVAAGGNIVMQETIGDTSQDDLEEYTANWHIRTAAVPFTRGDVLSNGGIEISILGQDAWRPKSLFMYGLDTAEGRPNEVVQLVSIPEWDLESLSTDPAEGKESIRLPVI